MTVVTNASKISQGEIYAKVRSIVAEALGVDEKRIEPTTSLVEELGAESIDFVDISFRIEKSFGMLFPKVSIIQRACVRCGPDRKLLEDGKLTEGGADFLQKAMPESAHRIQAGMAELSIPALFTPMTFVSGVVRELDSKQWAPDVCACGCTSFRKMDPVELPAQASAVQRTAFECQSCKEVLLGPTGDDLLFSSMGL